MYIIEIFNAYELWYIPFVITASLLQMIGFADTFRSKDLLLMIDF